MGKRRNWEYQKDSGLSFKVSSWFEDGVDNVDEFVSLQTTSRIFFKKYIATSITQPVFDTDNDKQRINHAIKQINITR